MEVRLHLLLTSALDVGGQLHAAVAAPPGKELAVPVVQEAGRPPSAATDDLESRKIFRLSRIEFRIVQSISLATITTALSQNTTHVKYSFRSFFT